MRNIQKTLVMLLFTLLIVVSCKRDTVRENTNPPNEEGKASTPSNVVYKKSAADIAATKNEWLRKTLSTTTNPAARGGCGLHVSSYSEVVQVTGAYCSSTTSWTIRYHIVSLDWVGSGYATVPVSESFTDVSSNALSYSLISSNAALVDPGCTNWWVDGSCLMVRDYIYDLTSVPAPSSAWPPDLGDYSLQLLSGFLPSCTPLRVGGDLKGGFTGAEYAAMPARLNAASTGAPGGLFITTDCSIVCPPPNIVCPTGGSLDYWPVSNPSNVTNVTVTTVGNLIFGVPAGTYNYSGTLNYTIGGTPYTSQPKTGSFVIL
jgi:hypothetical protein